MIGLTGCGFCRWSVTSEAGCPRIPILDGLARRGLIAWLAVRDNAETPTHWVILCDEHFEKTKRKRRKPLIFP